MKTGELKRTTTELQVKLYHYKVGQGLPARCPKRTTSPLGLRASRHAYERAISKGFLMPRIIPTGAQVIEAEFTGRYLTKLVVRFPYDETRDMVAVVADGNLLVTNWLNDKRDTHMTLDVDAYESTNSID